MNRTAVKIYLETEGRAWLKFRDGSQQVISILPDHEQTFSAQCYELYTAYDKEPDYLGRILFDEAGFWIYDGAVLHVCEQEQIANFIINYVEKL